MSSVSSRTLTEKRVSEVESWAVIASCLMASLVAIVWSWRQGAMLNYGDAIAHLHIARRVLDSRTPRFSQLGSVWLPLPHILLLPFVQNYTWWATGLAGVIPSAIAWLASCAGLYRLARRFVSVPAAALALVFFALNPNLLYLQTTAMTEPIFLCEMIWIVVWMVEWRDALRDEIESSTFVLPALHTPPPVARRRLALFRRRPLRIFDAQTPRQRGAWLGSPLAPRGPARVLLFATLSSRLQACIACALIAAVFTRYDGWVIALLVWTGMGLTLRRYRRLGSRAFWLLSIAVVAAPLLWFLYNSICFGDWLYFARGPYSAQAIELRTASHGDGPLHPGWHNPWVSLIFFLKVTELDAAAAWGNVLLAFAALGTLAAWLVERSRTPRSIFAWVLILWLPVPFYAYSVAYGSVPIFLPTWWPHAFYNTRYGLELLPALALGIGFAAEFILRALSRLKPSRLTLALPMFAVTALFVLIGLNCVQLLRQNPIVYVEGTKNLNARLHYDEAIPPFLDDLLTFLPRTPILMDTSIYPELVGFTGITFRQTINESDLQIFRNALAAPADHAAIIVAFDGDDIDRAVKLHPSQLAIAAQFTAKDQPTATIYVSTRWADQSPFWKIPDQPGKETFPKTETPVP